MKFDFNPDDINHELIKKKQKKNNNKIKMNINLKPDGFLIQLFSSNILSLWIKILLMCLLGFILIIINIVGIVFLFFNELYLLVFVYIIFLIKIISKKIKEKRY